MGFRERHRSRCDAGGDGSVGWRGLRSFCGLATGATLAPWLAPKDRGDRARSYQPKRQTICTDYTRRPTRRLRRSRKPARLEQILSSVVDRRKDRAERRTAHIAELRKRAAEAAAKLKRLYDAIENGIADVSDPMLKERVTELRAVRDQARADAERAEGALDRLGPSIASACAPRAAATAAITSAPSRNASKSMRKKFVSWDRKAYCCARSSPLQAPKRRVLAFPVLYRSGAPEEIRTPDPQIRSLISAFFDRAHVHAAILSPSKQATD